MWKEEIRALEKKLSELLVESAGIDMEGVKEQNEHVSATVDRTKKVIAEKSRQILSEHDMRGFYVLFENKSKETVEFPSFHGNQG